MKTMMGAISAAMLLAVPASAERYGRIYEDKITLSLLDFDTIRMVDGKPRAWTLSMMNFSGSVDYSRELDEFDCNTERYRVLTMKLYNSTDKQIGEEESNEWKYAAPGSTAYIKLEYACGGTPYPNDLLPLPAADIIKLFSARAQSNK